MCTALQKMVYREARGCLLAAARVHMVARVPYVCVCVCERVREREREKDRCRAGHPISLLPLFPCPCFNTIETPGPWSWGALQDCESGWSLPRVWVWSGPGGRGPAEAVLGLLLALPLVLSWPCVCQRMEPGACSRSSRPDGHFQVTEE